jgi:seryl-tRNA synthetase
MLDLRLIREKPDFVKQRLATRGGEDYSLLISELRRTAADQ